MLQKFTSKKKKKRSNSALVYASTVKLKELKLN